MTANLAEIHGKKMFTIIRYGTTLTTFMVHMGVMVEARSAYIACYFIVISHLK